MASVHGEMLPNSSLRHRPAGRPAQSRRHRIRRRGSLIRTWLLGRTGFLMFNLVLTLGARLGLDVLAPVVPTPRAVAVPGCTWGTSAVVWVCFLGPLTTGVFGTVFMQQARSRWKTHRSPTGAQPTDDSSGRSFARIARGVSRPIDDGSAPEASQTCGSGTAAVCLQVRQAARRAPDTSLAGALRSTTPRQQTTPHGGFGKRPEKQLIVRPEPRLSPTFTIRYSRKIYDSIIQIRLHLSLGAPAPA
jgi:hypothetical protein